MYSIPFFGAQFNPLDSTNYWMGQSDDTPVAMPGNNLPTGPQAINDLVVVAAVLEIRRYGDAPTQENVTATIGWNQVASVRTFTAAPMASGAAPISTIFLDKTPPVLHASVPLSITAGMDIHMGIISPAWATNPTDVVLLGQILVQDQEEFGAAGGTQVSSDQLLTEILQWIQSHPGHSRHPWRGADV